MGKTNNRVTSLIGSAMIASYGSLQPKWYLWYLSTALSSTEPQQMELFRQSMHTPHLCEVGGCNMALTEGLVMAKGY